MGSNENKDPSTGAYLSSWNHITQMEFEPAKTQIVTWTQGLRLKRSVF